MLNQSVSRWMRIWLLHYGLSLIAIGLLAVPAPAVGQTKLTATDGAEGFGVSVAIDATTAVVGAPRDDVRGLWSGSVFVYARVGEAWIQQAKLTASDGDIDDRFGAAVAISGDTIAVGAPGDETDGSFPVGSVYIFVRDGGGWAQQSKLLSPAWPCFLDCAFGPQFGASVSIDGDQLLVGSPTEGDYRRDLDLEHPQQGLPDGSAAPFERIGTAWHPRPRHGPVSHDTQTGTSVAVRGDVSVVGAPGVPYNSIENPGGPRSSAARVWVHSGGSWIRQTTLRGFIPSMGSQGHLFGQSVAIGGAIVVVGEPIGGAGSVYIFERRGTSWPQIARLRPSDTSLGDDFGSNVSVNANASLILASGDNGLYVFVPLGSTWIEHGKLVPGDGATLSNASLDSSGDTVIAGFSEAAYIFSGVGGDRFERNESCEDGTELTISSFHRHFDRRIVETRSSLRTAQELWRTNILSGLTLHNGADKDFFRLVLPDPAAEHASLIECGVIARDDRVVVNGAVIVRVLRPRPGYWTEPIDLFDASDGRSLYLTPTIVHSRTRPQVAHVNCPRRKGATEVCIAVGDRAADDRRDHYLEYELEVEYRIDLVRVSGDDSFLDSLLDDIGKRLSVIPLPCPGGVFPDCDRALGREFSVPHPFRSLPDCRSDGPLCTVHFPFRWKGGPLELKLRSLNKFRFELLDGVSGKAIKIDSRVHEFGDSKSAQEETFRLFVPDLAPGLYALVATGNAETSFSVEDLSPSHHQAH